MRIFGGVFIGIVFLTVGIILLLNTFFNFNINVFKLTIGILIILFGVFILFNGFGFQDSGNIVFRGGTIRVSEVQDEYNIIFSSGTVDLSKVKIEGEVKKIKVNTCLLYTSDAADEEDSVDLGGRRIIKKKKKKKKQKNEEEQ